MCRWRDVSLSDLPRPFFDFDEAEQWSVRVEPFEQARLTFVRSHPSQLSPDDDEILGRLDEHIGEHAGSDPRGGVRGLVLAYAQASRVYGTDADLADIVEATKCAGRKE